MAWVENCYNSYLSNPIQRLTGVSTVLSAVPGLDTQEALKMLSNTKQTVIELAKCGIIKFLGGDCKRIKLKLKRRLYIGN